MNGRQSWHIPWYLCCTRVPVPEILSRLILPAPEEQLWLSLQYRLWKNNGQIWNSFTRKIFSRGLVLVFRRVLGSWSLSVEICGANPWIDKNCLCSLTAKLYQRPVWYCYISPFKSRWLVKQGKVAGPRRTELMLLRSRRWNNFSFHFNFWLNTIRGYGCNCALISDPPTPSAGGAGAEFEPSLSPPGRTSAIYSTLGERICWGDRTLDILGRTDVQVAKFLLPLHPPGSQLHQLAQRQERSEMLGREYLKVMLTSTKQVLEQILQDSIKSGLTW